MDVGANLKTPALDSSRVVQRGGQSKNDSLLGHTLNSSKKGEEFFFLNCSLFPPQGTHEPRSATDYLTLANNHSFRWAAQKRLFFVGVSYVRGS